MRQGIAREKQNNPGSGAKKVALIEGLNPEWTALYAALWSNCPNLSRHCEPTGRANARPMTGSAKQSMARKKESEDCLVASAFALLARADRSLLAITSGKRHATTLSPSLRPNGNRACRDEHH